MQSSKPVTTKSLADKTQEDTVFKKMRIKITVISLLLVTVVLVIVFSVLGFNIYNAKLDLIANVLDESIISQVGEMRIRGLSISPEDNEMTEDPLSPQDEKRMREFAQNNSFILQNNYFNENYIFNGTRFNSNTPKLGLNSEFKADQYVPIIFCAVNYDARKIVPFANNVAQLTDQTLEKQERFVNARYGITVDSELKLMFLKRTFQTGDVIAITDISSVHDYMMNIVRLFLMMTIMIWILLGTTAWLASNWIIRPAKEAWQRQRRFIGDAGHELKTPVQVVIASAENIVASTDASNESKKWAKIINEEADKMKNLIEDLLFLATTATVKSGEETTFDLARSVEKATLQFEIRSLEKGNEIIFENTSSTGDVVIKADKTKIDRLIGILVDNAFKNSDPNTPITCCVSSNKKHAVLSVSDIGKEISDEDAKMIFERFWQADKSRTMEKGYGLGLAIAKDIVDTFDGTIEAKSKNGTTTFTVVLPLASK